MTYRIYKIFNLTEFMALDLVSKKYTFFLDEIGQKDILVTRGELVSILYEGIFLPLDLNGKNPFKFEDMAIYKDANNDVFLGFLVNED